MESNRSAPIIGVLLSAAALLLAGCGIALRLGYGQGDALAFRWFDGYVDFNGMQELRARTALRDWFAWHRRTQLPDYAELLGRARREIVADTTPERACAWWRDVSGRVAPALERAAPAIGELLLTLTPAQLARIERRQADDNDKFRGEYLQTDPTRRRRQSIERVVERSEKLYGELDEPQRVLVARWVADSPFDPEAWLAERQRRQQDAVQTMRRLIDVRASGADAEAQVKAYVQRGAQSPRLDYRRYDERLTEFNCAFAAALHNGTTPRQREVAAKTLKGWEDELRAMAGGAPG